MWAGGRHGGAMNEARLGVLPRPDGVRGRVWRLMPSYPRPVEHGAPERRFRHCRGNRARPPSW
ncbi:hypothetical protein SXIM_15470 [Streptomyces xiamenensis]|uniref:Uncharacterized protein n=1 Tax=Streptomyces xiamenensis TaxID=408015 RepID=A0A0F7CNH7_9ACTN|nr:hypothetical protein SXIM_15470 [Streptomyces xiamenensis]